MFKNPFLLSILFSLFLITTVKADDLPYKEGELIVRFAPKENSQQRTQVECNSVLASINGGTVQRSVKWVPGLTLVKLPANSTVQSSLSAFKNKNGILYAEPNYKIHLFSNVPNDTRFNEQWGMHNTGQTWGKPGADIAAPQVWDIRTDASDVVVAVLDTGVDYEHPDLADNIWVNEAELNGTPGIDDDDPCNGYIDDIYGYDFYADANCPMDYNGHGTHIAGIIGAVGNNNEGVTGVCWNVKIMCLTMSAGQPVEMLVLDAAEAIYYAFNNGAKVINASWGFSFSSNSQTLENAIDAADSAGVLFVAAAGNYGYNIDVNEVYPASYDDPNNIISVMATNHADQVASYSDYGATMVDLAAPGGEMAYNGDPEGILSTVLNDDYDFYAGTSMSAPYVAGACALVWAQHPTWTHLQVKEAIINSADELYSLQNKCVSQGRLNLYRALTYKPNKLTITNTDDITGAVDPTDEENNQITYTITFTNNDTSTANDITVTDHLPESVYFVSASPEDAAFGYDWLTHCYVWHFDSIAPSDPNTVTLTVQVNGTADPCGIIENRVDVENDDFYSRDIEFTLVDCWGGDVIFVDASATGYNTGTCWADAYTDLKSALDRAAGGCADTIWVASGTYTPKGGCKNSYVLPDGVELIGGLASNEDPATYDLAERNFYANHSILDGADTFENIISVEDADDATVIDGLVICNASNDGIHLDGSEPLITHCTIKNNGQYGIFSSGSTEVPIIQNCNIYDNLQSGISYNTDDITIKNCWIHHNNYYGIICGHANGYGTLRNNTICYNTHTAVTADYYNNLDISNCILFGNNDHKLQQLTYCYATYSCLDPNIPAYINITPDEDGNIFCPPGFAYATEDNDDTLYDFHLDPCAYYHYCIDNGSNTGISTEFDIDNDDRIINSTVDMGADESDPDCTDVSRPRDLNADGAINLHEFSILAADWQSVPGDPNCNFDNTGDSEDFIDMADFCEFLNPYDSDNGYWLWQACWRSTGGIGCMLAGGGESIAMSLAAPLSSQSLAAGPDLPSIEDQIDQLYDIINWMTDFWDLASDSIEADNISEQQWFDNIDKLYDIIDQLEQYQ